jgi:hypothetical protein
MPHIIKALDRDAFGLGTKVPALRSFILRGVIFLVHSAGVEPMILYRYDRFVLDQYWMSKLKIGMKKLA